MQWVNYAQLARDVAMLASRLPRVSAVLGVPRSGMVAAGMLATYLGVPGGVVGDRPRGGRRLNRSPSGPVLVVDDSLHSGATMAAALGQVEGPTISCSVYVTRGQEHLVDIHAQSLAVPRFYEWNIWGSASSRFVMTDLDGVLCLDPPVYDDDGPAYASAIEHATQAVYPTMPLHSICTNRIDGWRETTQAWLDARGIEAGALVMHPARTADERRSEGDYGRRKGEIFDRSSALIFVESSLRQAARIRSLTDKLVVWWEGRELVRRTHG